MKLCKEENPSFEDLVLYSSTLSQVGQLPPIIITRLSDGIPGDLAAVEERLSDDIPGDLAAVEERLSDGIPGDLAAVEERLSDGIPGDLTQNGSLEIVSHPCCTQVHYLRCWSLQVPLKCHLFP